MKLTNYILDLGRIVAFHPGLKRITGSITATLFLSQLIYWIDKTKDGWIYKDSYDIEEETGLSVYEQQTARKILVDKGVLEENYKRLDHKIAFRVNQEKLNDLWEETSGKVSNPRYAKPLEEKKQLPEIPLPIEDKPTDLRDFQNPAYHPDHPANRTDAQKKEGGILQGYIDMANSPGARKEMIINDIRELMESKFAINMGNKEWNGFLEYVYGRQERHKEPASRFVEWALKQGFDPMFWTPKKCETLYPRAFANDQNKPKEDFVAPLPKREEKKNVPMPDDVKRKRNLT